MSPATAWRVVNDSASVRPETRRKVERAMRELLYVASTPPAAVGAIGLFVPEFGNPIFSALAQAMEKHARRAGFATILCNTAGSAEREADYVHMLLERRVEGMIFISAEITDIRSQHGHYGKLLERGAKLVFVNGGSEAFAVPSVGVDERAAGLIATQHLIDLGHRRIGFVAGTEYASPTRWKMLGRQDALRLAGLDPDGLVAHAAFDVAGGREALRALIERTGEGRPTGVICSSDLMAIGAMREARARGLRVPHDLSIVGFDGIEATTWTEPALTTVEQPIAEIAEMAVNALHGLIEDPTRHMPNFLFRPRMREGASTAPPR